MNILENAIRSVSGSVDKAILCVKKPAKASVKGGSNMLKGQVNKRPIDLQAKLLSESKAGTFSFLKSKTEIVEEFGYHVLKVKYNPSKIRIDSRAGSFIQSGPGGAGTNTLTQITMPAQTRMNLELLFDVTPCRFTQQPRNLMSLWRTRILSSITFPRRGFASSRFTALRAGPIWLISDSQISL